MSLKTGDQVRVRRLDPPGHHRTPTFVQAKKGVVIALAGQLPNAELMAYGRSEAGAPVWRVRFQQNELWQDYRGDPADTVMVDLYEHWLEMIG